MPLDRDASRLRVADEGLTAIAVERVARISFARMPITLVDRARGQLRRFFSDEPWTVEDDAALSGLVGPGDGWTDEQLAPGIHVGFGWRGGAFRIDLEADEVAPAPGDAAPSVAPAAPPDHARTLGDTFEDTVVVDMGRTPEELRFSTGPGTTGASGHFTREEQGSSAAVAALFREFDMITQVRIEPGVVSITLDDAQGWQDNLLAIFDTVTNGFVPPRNRPADRQYERAIKEIGALDTANPRDLARILDATTSPDAAFRRLAMTKLENADALVVQKPWARGLEDSSRAVRRATVRAMAYAAHAESRSMLERALNDKDACVRYYAVRGLAELGAGRNDESMERRRRDDDIRVRLAADAAIAGITPQ